MTVDARARTKLTDDVLDRILERIAAGMPKAHACAEAGVSRQALYQLAERNADVAERLEAAEQLGAEFYRQQVMHAPAGKDATDDWKRWAWLAERLHPEAFSPPKQRVEQTGRDGGPQQHEHVVDVPGLVRIARAKKG